MPDWVVLAMLGLLVLLALGTVAGYGVLLARTQSALLDMARQLRLRESAEKDPMLARMELQRDIRCQNMERGPGRTERDAELRKDIEARQRREEALRSRKGPPSPRRTHTLKPLDDVPRPRDVPVGQEGGETRR